MNRRNFIKIISCAPIIGFLPKLSSQTNDYLKDQRHIEDYPKTIKELQQWMESILPVGESTNHRYSVTGEEYIEYGATTDWDSEEKLCRFIWQAFRSNVDKISSNETGYKLYWRIKPEYSEWADKKARIYTRYLISNKEEILWREGQPVFETVNKDWKIKLE
jgi:hypothetical protein